MVGLIWFGASADQPQASEQHWNNGVTSAHLAVRRATLLISLVVTMNGRGTDVKVLVERALLTRKSANHSSGALAFSPIRAKTGTSE